MNQSRHRSAEPRDLPPGRFLGRRGFLAVLGAGAMTLAMSMLEWLPLARTAGADPGSEYPDCGVYGDGPGGPICVGAPYSPQNCGPDNWFRTGCYNRPEGGEVCYQAAVICRAAGRENEARNAWRWVLDGVTYRCADGKAYYEGAPNPEIMICSATLSSPEPEPTPAPAPTPAPEPEPSPPPSRRPWPSSLLSELPVLTP